MRQNVEEETEDENEDDVNELIEEAARDKATDLDLSEQDLVVLPESVCNLNMAQIAKPERQQSHRPSQIHFTAHAT